MAEQLKRTAWSSRPRRVLVLLGALALVAVGLVFGVMRADAAPGPTVSSFTLAGASPTNAGSVSWKLVFSSSVTGVAASNFSLVQAGGVSGAGSVSVSGSGTTYTRVCEHGVGERDAGVESDLGGIDQGRVA